MKRIERGDLPNEALDFLDSMEFEKTYCYGCVGEDACPCGMIPGDFLCIRADLWQYVAEMLLEELGDWDTLNTEQRTMIVDECKPVILDVLGRGWV